jgi:hypothetical protein
MANDPCTSTLHHGPGHQSTTRCQKRGPHAVHAARYGSGDDYIEWYGRNAVTGFFDEPKDLPKRATQ